MTRFDAAIARLRESGLVSRLERHESLSRAEFDVLVSEYFGLGIACPFLEGEACSIHPVRPLICRQYLVTSDPAHCASLSQENISRVIIAADVLTALAAVERADTGARAWIPMILVPLGGAATSDTRRTAPEWMSLIIGEIDKARGARLVPSAKAPSSGNVAAEPRA